ncbi:MAG: hypothetical protein R3F07_20710 [Opitutaceae bacterium]
MNRGSCWLAFLLAWSVPASGDSIRPDLPADNGAIGEQADLTIVPLGRGILAFVDAGAGLTWRREGNRLILRPESGLVLFQAGRESVDYNGIEIELEARRFQLYDGTLAVDTGGDGLQLGLLFRGKTFESGADGLVLEQLSAPLVSLGAGGKTLYYRDLRTLIRDDQARIHRVALRAVEIMADSLEAQPDRLSSTDLAAMLESMRLLRLRIPGGGMSDFHAVLLAAARREEFERRHRPFEWPALLSVPVPVEPWDRVFEW